jgi:DNA-binding CsgD family transcriptional regulator
VDIRVFVDQHTGPTATLVDPRTRTIGAPWALVGREHEIATIHDCVIRNGPGAIVLAGRPGLGRTRLAREAILAAGRRGHPTAHARATRAMSRIPLGALAHLVPVGAVESNPAAALQAAVTALTRAPHERWLVVAVDDAHLLDELSACLVHALVLTGAASVVITVLNEAPEPEAVTAIWKDGLAPRLELAPLARREQDRLLGSVLGGVVESRTCEYLWRMTAGCARLLREVAQAGQETGNLRIADGVWRWHGPLTPTPRLSHMVLDQVGVLQPTEQAAVELLAVGEPLPLAELIAMCPPEVAASLERRGIITAEYAGGQIETRLAQPLHAEVLRAQMPLTAASLLRATLAGRVTAHRPYDLVRAGALLADGEGSISEPGLLVAAASTANARGAHVAAERIAGAAIDHGAGCDARIALAEGLRWQGRSLDAENVAAHATNLARTDDERAGLAATRALNLFYGLGRAQEAVAALDEANESVGPRASAKLTAVRSILSFSAGRPEEAAELGRSVLASGLPEEGSATIRACAAVTAAQAVLGAPGDALRFAELGRAMTGRGRGDPEIFSARWALAHDELLALSLAGRVGEAEQRAAELHRMSMAEAASAGDGVAALQVGSAALAAGRAAVAVRWLTEAAAKLTESDPIGCLALCRAHLTQAHAQLGDVIAAAKVSAAEMVEGSAAVQIYEPQTVLAQAWRAAAEKRMTEAGDEAIRAASIAAAMTQPMIEALALHTAVRFGRADEVSGRLRELAEYVDGLAPTYAEHAEAVVRCDGERLDDVADEFGTFGAALLAAEAATQAAEAHDREGHRRRAIASAGRAVGLARDCGGALTPALIRSSLPPPLTAREREVAALAAAGQHSREIARRLVISVRTVETHLAHAFGKLGIHGRAELAAALGECWE